MIDFNRPAFTGREFDYIRDAVQRGMLCGDGEYTKRCSQWMMDKFHVNHVMLTTSCTHALEMAAHLCDIKPGDEVIMPSYTFVSTADAFVLKGAKIVFVDIRPDTMNIDEKLIEAAVTEKTKVIVPVHYAGEKLLVPLEILGVTVSMRQRTILWERAVQSFLTGMNMWRKQRS